MALISLKLERATINISVNPRKDNTMKTTKSQTSNINNDLKEAFALWEHKKGDLTYYTGKTSGDDPISIVAFVETSKKNPKQPDVRVYEQVEKGEERQEIASLWQNESKVGNTYYSGYTNEKERVIAFINKDTKEGKYPSIRAYYKQDDK